MLRNTTDRPFAAIFASCSGDVADISNAAYRHAAGFQSVVLSPSSTAGKIANTTAFPKVARFSSSEKFNGRAMAKLVEGFGWKRVVILHEDTLWGESAAEAFATHLRLFVPDSMILNEGNQSFSASAVLAGDIHANSLLDRIEAAEARIVYIAASQHILRAVFSAFYECSSTRTYFASRDDFAWLTAYLTASFGFNEDGTANVTAIRGAEGALSTLELTDLTNPKYNISFL